MANHPNRAKGQKRDNQAKIERLAVSYHHNPKIETAHLLVAAFEIHDVENFGLWTDDRVIAAINNAARQIKNIPETV